jgi:hypothetical protein
LATRVKVWLSADEWNIIKAAFDNGAAIPVDARKMYFQVPLRLTSTSKTVAKERSKIRKRRESVSATSKAMHEACSNASYTNSIRHNRHGSRVENLEHSDRTNLSRNLDSSFLSVDERGNIMPKTPEVALVEAQTYLYTTQPNLGDPREDMHQAALQGLRLVENKLTAKEEETCHTEGTHKPRSPCHHNIPRCRCRSRRSRSPSPKTLQQPTARRNPKIQVSWESVRLWIRQKEMGHHALLAEFAALPYPKDSNYPMISRNMMDLRSHSHDSQTIYKQSEY